MLRSSRGSIRSSLGPSGSGAHLHSQNVGSVHSIDMCLLMYETHYHRHAHLAHILVRGFPGHALLLLVRDGPGGDSRGSRSIEIQYSFFEWGFDPTTSRDRFHIRVIPLVYVECT